VSDRMTEEPINPVEVIRERLGSAADWWLMKRAKETGRYELTEWLWYRVSELDGLRVDELEKIKGSGEKIGEEM